ncbi:DUF3168 domain-containing protein [Bacillus sp. MCCB 382]|uniref:DUF3168 domain-containing protein n=1 Tax=Bacillus sp. MCCB 382 TaxID=2860197 RepID=UPI001C586CA9|nr:DUF3168 domain-containing protein [Bacillus sp. MCCB 382]
MTKTSLLALQMSVYAKLASHTPLTSKISGVYDEVSEGTAYPYVTIGNPTVNDWGSHTTEGEDITLTLHVWSDYKGKREVYEIFNLILEALTTTLTLSGGFSMEFQRREFMEVLEDNVTNARHGVIRLRYKIMQ